MYLQSKNKDARVNSSLNNTCPHGASFSSCSICASGNKPQGVQAPNTAAATLGTSIAATTPGFGRAAAVPSAQLSSTKGGSCPHGATASSCPLCKGGGGGLQDQKQEKKSIPSYYMTWGEAYAVWKSIQNAMTRYKDKIDQYNFLSFLNQMRLDNQFLPKQVLPTENVNLLAQPQNQFKPFTIVGQMFQFLTKQAQQLIKQPLVLSQKVVSAIANNSQLLAQKIVSMSYEMFQIVEDAFKNNIEQIKAFLAQGQWRKVLGQSAIFSAVFSQAESVLKKVSERLRLVFDNFFKLFKKSKDENTTTDFTLS
ncbi:MAG: hypothetical protein AAGI66_05885 [Cyanobacteria bacterium P01_H01_bin.74]